MNTIDSAYLYIGSQDQHHTVTTESTYFIDKITSMAEINNIQDSMSKLYIDQNASQTSKSEIKSKVKDREQDKKKVSSFALKCEINQLIKEAHDPKLVKPDEAPNSNRIYHLYNTGMITSQKGGDAYLQRTNFIEHLPIVENYICIFGSMMMITNEDELRFPTKSSEDGINYAIVTLENAIKIRNKMIDYVAAVHREAETISENF